MAETALKFIGWLFALTPEVLLHGLSTWLGWLMYTFSGKRRRRMLHNLAAVYPDQPASWHRKIARSSCNRLMETGLLAIASPHFSKARIRRMAKVEATAEDYFREVAAKPRPIVTGSAHLAYWEALCWLPILVDTPFPEASTIYRPLSNPNLNRWVVNTRSRFGVALLSRKSGIHTSMHILRRNGLVNVLFDQNAGGHGSLTTFFGRKISMTELPALLVNHTGADLCFIGTRRTGFWRMEVFIRKASHDGTVVGIMSALNLAFEELLRTDENISASWLWAHDRWKINVLPVELAKLTEKRNLVEADARFRAAQPKP